MNLKDKRTNLINKLKNREYRRGWVEEGMKMVLPYQIQANRTKRDWSQAILGREAGMKQNAVSRLESMDYGNLSINTLLRLADAFDCGLLVKFVPFSRLVREFEDVSPSALEVESFTDDFGGLMSWTDSRNTDNSLMITSDVDVYLTEQNATYESQKISSDYDYQPVIAEYSNIM